MRNRFGASVWRWTMTAGWVAALALVGGCSGGGGGGDTLTPSTVNVTVRGTVVNDSTGAAIPGAVVTGNVATRATTTSGSDGSFTLTFNGVSKTAKISITVTIAPNVFTGTARIVITTPETKTSTLTITGQAGSASVDVAASGGTTSGGNETLSGTITAASSGNPVSGAVISAAGKDTTSTTTGSYSLTGLPAGSVQVTVTATGFTTSVNTVGITAGGTNTHNVTLTSSGSGNVDITQPPPPPDFDTLLTGSR